MAASVDVPVGNSKPEKRGGCSYCSQETTQQCAKCQKAYFCSRRHQEIMWPSHKHQCGQGETRYQPHLQRWETDLFAGTILVEELEKALVLPDRDFQYSPVIATGLLMVLRRKGCESGVTIEVALRNLPTPCDLDYFWKVCSEYANCVAPGDLKYEAVRRTFRRTVQERMIKSKLLYKEPYNRIAESGMASYYFIALPAELLHFSEVPRTYQHELLRSICNFHSLTIARDFGKAKLTDEEKQENLVYQELAYNRLIEVYGRSFDHRWIEGNRATMQIIIDRLIPLYFKIGSQHSDPQAKARIHQEVSLSKVMWDQRILAKKEYPYDKKARCRG